MAAVDHHYQVTAIDRNGVKLTKIITLDAEEQLMTYLDHAGLDVLSLKKLPAYYKYLNYRKFFTKIKRSEVLELLENLQLIVRSGLPTNTGIMDLARDLDNPRLKDVLEDIGFRLQLGMSLSRAMEKYSTIFGETTISLISIGEETGELDNTLRDAANHMKNIEGLKSKAKSALIYPAFTFAGLFSAMTFWLVVVMPNIIGAFTSFDMELPAATKMIMAMSDFMREWLFTVIALLIFSITSLFVLRAKVEKVRYHTDKIILKLPIFSVILGNFYYAFFAEYTRLMVAAGLPLYQALSIMEKALSNMVFKTAVAKVRESIAVGRPFSESLQAEGLFPALVIRMISVGEQTGKMEEQLGYIATYYYTKVETLSQNISKMIEPLIIVFLGLFMLVLMLGLLGPVYNLLGGVGKV